jgi:hypothetical protein
MWEGQVDNAHHHSEYILEGHMTYHVMCPGVELELLYPITFHDPVFKTLIYSFA